MRLSYQTFFFNSVFLFTLAEMIFSQQQHSADQVCGRDAFGATNLSVEKKEEITYLVVFVQRFVVINRIRTCIVLHLSRFDRCRRHQLSWLCHLFGNKNNRGGNQNPSDNSLNSKQICHYNNKITITVQRVSRID